MSYKTPVELLREIDKWMEIYLLSSSLYNEVDSIRADIKKSIASVLDDGWHPMATAPKDSTFIQLLGPSGYTTTPYRVVIGRWVPGYRDHWVNHCDDAFTDGGEEPTHWKPWDPPVLTCDHIVGLDNQSRDVCTSDLRSPGSPEFGVKYSFCPLCGEKV